jgi:AraC-like DNA-binding protein
MGFYGLHRYQHGVPMARHRHVEPYLAIVAEGGYQEAGDAGRIEARPGDILLHGAYDAHRDAFERSGSTVLNLPLEAAIGSGFGRIEDVDAIVRLAERDPWLASIQACAELARGRPPLSDWPDLLAATLRDDPSISIACWADSMGLAATSVSRGFARAYGVTPKRFRLEARAHHATQLLPTWRGALADLAAELGFADQAHMSRAVAAITGHTPVTLRAKSVQASRLPAR